jgi:alkylhydroperoxidase family enzyme
LARRLGATDAELAGVASGTLDGFGPAWRSALRAADAMTRGAGRIPDHAFDELAEHWSSEQIVEIVAVVGLFNYFNRIANALDIPSSR